MKKSFLILAAALAVAGAGLAIAAPASTQAPARSAESPDLLPAEIRSSLRESIAATVRGLLNFRKQSPLSEDQKTKIKTTLASHRAEIVAQIKSGKAARQAMHDAVIQHGPDSPEAKAAAAAIGEVATRRALLAGSIGSEIRPILTETQQKALDSIRDEAGEAVDRLISSPGSL